MTKATIDDGGYAFPCGPDDKSGWSAEYGMTRREHYAGLAMAALIQGYATAYGSPTNAPDEIVKEAVSYADSLIAALKVGA